MSCGWAVGGAFWVVVGKRRAGRTRRRAHEEAVGTRRRAGRGGRDEDVGGTMRRAVVGESLW